MLVGRSIHTLGKDGRVSIPSKMRETLIDEYGSDDLYMVLLPTDILCLYPVKEFEKLAERLEQATENRTGEIMDGIKKSALICSYAINCKIDGSGRILIPSDMREAVQIKQEILVIGAKNHIQLWDPDLWQREKKRLERSFF
ncbi:MAG: division/cell wall cluster transcriptional repressor MraZ [Candidatus Poribacteria bacterium]